MSDILTAIPDSECSCEDCVGMCEFRPCWPIPAEAKGIIDAGLGRQLMLDYWCAEEPDSDDVHIVAPAVPFSEGKRAPFWPTGRCAFLTDAGLCGLHDRGLKPTEGRKAHHSRMRDDGGLHEAVARTWDSDEGRDVVRAWREAQR